MGSAAGVSYGGGLFEMLPRRDFLQLCHQFQVKPEQRCQGHVWARARHAVRTRDDIRREKEFDHSV